MPPRSDNDPINPFDRDPEDLDLAIVPEDLGRFEDWEEEEEDQDDDLIAEEDVLLPDLGTCCGCGGRDRVRNVIAIDRLAPQPGTGWGCVVCGLRSDGALAVLCDTCVEVGREAVEVADGYLDRRRRVPIESLAATPFAHDMSRHLEDEA